MLNALYTIIIYPIYFIVEFAYRVFSEVFNNTGISIVGVSITISLLCLPVYAVAEAWQETEREKQKELSYWVKHIKKAFKGDEQYMMLSEYYRQNNYNPLYSLRSSLSILIQIPFFLAAYRYLSHNPELIGKSFLFIKDMGKPDQMFHIGSFGINILPIAMTLINCTAGAIYSRGLGLRDKLQIYGMAILFLVILYGSPSGLVFYWTMNNIFSLVKNIFYKLNNPLKKFHICCCIAVTCAVAFLIAKKFSHVTILILFDACLIALPWILSGAKHLFKGPLSGLCKDTKKCTALFILTCISLAVLCGYLIPSFLIVDSTAEYCYLDGQDNPIYFLINSFLQAFGLFVFWPCCLYFLFNKKIKAILCFSFVTFLILGLVNNFIFQGNYGTILPEVVFTEHKSFFPTKQEFILNVSALLLLFLTIYILFKINSFKIISTLSLIILVSITGISILNFGKISTFLKNYEKPNLSIDESDKIINLSKNGKNVVVIMLDRATGYMVDPVFQNKPELYDIYDGFVKYPNTVSFGSWTIQGAVCLYGGYEYTPWAMNHRRNIPMQDKHNEGLSLQAKIFADNGFKCTVIDPPYPNYDTPPVDKAFKDIPNTKFHQTIGKFNSVWCKENNITLRPIRKMMIERNFLWFGIFKISPLIMRPVIHYADFWNSRSHQGQDIVHFVDNYAVLDYLPKLTNINNEENCFVIMDNEICHGQVYSQVPDYRPAQEITDHGKGKWNDNKEFHVNTAAYIALGRWLNFLKENEMYDNTRIIIVADHGANTRMPELFDKSIAPDDFEKFNPVLMIKDFYSQGKMQEAMDFMTHSDVPAMAFDNLIETPVNPYTGKIIRKLDTNEKYDQAVISVSRANGVKANENNGYKIKNSDWYTVRDNIFKSHNWKHEMPEYKELQ